MIALQITFQAGRFHATPWDRSVNEGQVEWPPSPWRVLRALVAGFHVVRPGDDSTFCRVLDKLAAPPRFLLPPSTEGHSRHYMPQGDLSKTLVIDAFRATERDARAFVIWDDVALDDAERALLAKVCGGITYLGRAEAWCEISPIGKLPGTDPDLIQVDLTQRGTTNGPEERRLGIAADYRGTGLLAALSVETAAMRKAKKMLPPGAAWMEYRFQEGYGALSPLERRASAERGSPLPEGGILRFILEAPNDALRPPVSETITCADAFRSTAMKNYSDREGEAAPPEISGRIDGKPSEGHRHAFYLPRDLDGDGRIDHIDVWFRDRLTHAAFVAVTQVDRLYSYRLGRNVNFSVTYLGSGDRTSGRRWSTATPFVLGAHPRSRGSAARRARFEPEAQIERSLSALGLPPARVTLTRPSEALRHPAGGATTLASFRSVRKDDTPIGTVLGAMLEFAEPITGPLALGRYAHFGMGQFVSID